MDAMTCWPVLLLFGALISAAPAQDNFASERAQLLRNSRCTYAAPPVRSDGKIDAPRLVAELTELHANTYRWVVHPKDDLHELSGFLPLAKAQGIRVWVTVNPPSERKAEKARSSAQMMADYEQWAKDFARLSLVETNFVAWSIDDFVWNLKFFTPEALKKILAGARSINPRFAFLPCCYFKGATPEFVTNYGSMCDGIIFPYRDESSRANLTNATHVAAEVKVLRERFGPAKPIIASVYASPHSKLGGTTPEYVEQVLVAAKACADGVSVYRHPNQTRDPVKHAIVKRLYSAWAASAEVW
jgi:hypothetical protein